VSYVISHNRFSQSLFVDLLTAFATVFVTAACACAQAQPLIPSTEEIVALMTQAQVENRASLRPYTVTRAYRLFQGTYTDEAKSLVIAEIIVEPPGSKKYTVQSMEGSGRGEKLVRRMLDGEIALSKDYGSISVTRSNYDFLFAREDILSGHPCHVLTMLPRRGSTSLLRGSVWVDSSTYLFRRIEGEPAKSPSWWLKDVRIVLLYGYVSGMWLQTASQATADVRVLGPSSVRWQDVSYQIKDISAVASLALTTSSEERQ
jgi:hypothetical protein